MNFFGVFSRHHTQLVETAEMRNYREQAAKVRRASNELEALISQALDVQSQRGKVDDKNNTSK